MIFLSFFPAAHIMLTKRVLACLCSSPQQVYSQRLLLGVPARLDTLTPLMYCRILSCQSQAVQDMQGFQHDQRRLTCCRQARQAKRCTAWCVRMASMAEGAAPACQPFIRSGSVAIAQPLCAILLMWHACNASQM